MIAPGAVGRIALESFKIREKVFLNPMANEQTLPTFYFSGDLPNGLSRRTRAESDKSTIAIIAAVRSDK